MLPEPSGPHSVGVTTLTSKFRENSVLGTHRLKDGSPALESKQVVFNIFYPAALNTKMCPSEWVLHPRHDFAAGYSKFMGIATWLMRVFTSFFSWNVSVPATQDVPLLKPPNDIKNWPVIVFSHGLGGTRTVYSQVCTSMASNGAVVIAVEHRDGTGPMVVDFDAEHSSASHYINPEDVRKLNGENLDSSADKMAWREDQLILRRLEIYEAIAVIRRLVQGHQDGISVVKRTSTYDLNSALHNWDNWSDHVAAEEDIILSGHSFGGATVLSLLSNDPPSGFGTLSVSHALLHDPWVEPFPGPGPIPLPLRARPELCIINSEQFTVWGDHFARLQALVKSWRESPDTQTSLVTLVQSQHFNFSDFPLAIPYRRAKARQLMRDICDISGAFLSGTLPQSLKKYTHRDMVVVKKGRSQRKRLIGELGDIVVH